MITDRVKRAAKAFVEDPNDKIPSVCPHCGADMKHMEDDVGHEAMACIYCGYYQPIVKSDKERLKHVQTDMEIRNIKFAEEHKTGYLIGMLIFLAVCVGGLLLLGSM